MRIYLAGQMPSGVYKLINENLLSRWRKPITDGCSQFINAERAEHEMRIFLAGTERLETDVKQVNKDTNLYLAEADGVAAHYFNKLKEEGKDTNLYLAESGGCLKAYLSEADLYKDAFILQSFYYASDFTEKVILPNCKDFLLDSGAFTFMTSAKGKKVDWNEYVEKYADFINRNHIKKYFELDIDSIVGYDEVQKITRRLEKLTNVQPIPVWHQNRGIEGYKRMCEEYPYVAIGGLVGGGGASSEYSKKHWHLFPYFIQTAHQNNAKIHALGFTSMEGIHKYHFDSVDSTAWVSGNRFGAVYWFDGRTMKKIDKPQGKRVKTNQVAIHNFNEWKKFQRYAERSL